MSIKSLLNSIPPIPNRILSKQGVKTVENCSKPVDKLIIVTNNAKKRAKLHMSGGGIELNYGRDLVWIIMHLNLLKQEPKELHVILIEF